MTAALPDPKIRLFVSDMDSTMIENECIDEMARLLDEKKGTGSHYFDQVKAITKAAMEEGKDFTWSLHERIGILAEAGFEEAWLPEVYARLKPMPHAPELLAHLKEHNVHTVLVSGGFTYFAEKIGKRLGFDEVFANALLFENGKLVGVRGPQDIMEGKILDGQAKLTILHEIAKNSQPTPLVPTQIAAIGDGSNDAAMVRYAGYGIAYRGSNPALLAASTHQTTDLSAVPELLAGPARSRVATTLEPNGFAR